MGRITRASGFRLFVVLAAIAAPATAFAHAKLTTPKPRLDSDGIKLGPCGGTPRTKSFQQYQPGQSIPVTWREGIDHGGCFDVLFSPANDTGWVRLGRYDDTDIAAQYADASTTKMVTLPNMKCESCTLAVRQLMNTGDVLCNANTQDEMDGGVPTYFSCADIRVGDFPDAAPSENDGGTVTPPADSGLPTTTPTDGGGKFVDASDEGSSGSAGRPGLRSGEGGGCSVAMGATTGLSFGVTAALLALALGRRRRRKSPPKA